MSFFSFEYLPYSSTAFVSSFCFNPVLSLSMQVGTRLLVLYVSEQVRSASFHVQISRTVRVYDGH